MDNKKSTPGGTQAVDRALQILGLLASAHERGLHLTDVADATGLPRPTAYRLLCALADAGYAMRGDSKRYHLGLQAMHIGLVAMRRAPAITLWSPVMKSIARISEDTVYLVVRNGDFAHAIHMEQGPKAMQKFPSDVGGFLLLGLGTGGRALLGTLAAHEVGALWQRHPQSYALKEISQERLVDLAREAKANRYIITENAMTEGVVGVAVAVQGQGPEFIALCIAAETHRMPVERRHAMGDLLLAMAATPHSPATP